MLILFNIVLYLPCDMFRNGFKLIAAVIGFLARCKFEDVSPS